MSARYSLLFWDLDGTLTDPKEGITKSIHYALDRLGIAAPDLDALTSFIGPPLAASFQEFYGLDAGATAHAIASYRERFESQGLFENKVYPEIPPLLEELGRLGVRMAVATSKPLPSAERILDHFDLRRHFYAVYAADTQGRVSLKRDVLGLGVAGLSAGERSHAAMIGDHPVDLEAAHHHGLAAVGVLYGYGDPGRLRRASPRFLAQSVEELRGHLLP